MNTTANKITIIRIALIPVFMILLIRGFVYLSLAVYILACVSDFFDGYIARSCNQITDFGKFLDPLADKMLVLASMCIFIEKGLMPAWIVAVVIFRELAVSGLRLVAVGQGTVIPAAMSGKVKTFVTMVALGILIIVRESWVPCQSFLTVFCQLCILVTTVYSGIDYFVKNKNVFSRLP